MNCLVSSKISDKWDDFNLKFHFLMEMFLTPIPMVYIFPNLFVFNVDEFNNRILFLTAKLLKTRL